MRKNRTAKFIFNGALLAVMAVLGVTAYQVANKPEHIQEVLPLESTKESDTAKTDGDSSTDDSSLAEAGTNMVEADLDGISDTGILDSESLINESDNSSATDIASLDNSENYDIIEYDYITKTERVIPWESISDYSSTTTTTYELDSYHL